MKNENYIVIEELYLSDLIKEVNKHYDKYIPQGGICRISEIGEVAFYQAMIKREK